MLAACEKSGYTLSDRPLWALKATDRGAGDAIGTGKYGLQHRVGAPPSYAFVRELVLYQLLMEVIRCAREKTTPKTV